MIKQQVDDGRVLRALRERACLQQIALARAAGVKGSTVCHAEKHGSCSRALRAAAQVVLNITDAEWEAMRRELDR